MQHARLSIRLPLQTGASALRDAVAAAIVACVLFSIATAITVVTWRAALSGDPNGLRFMYAAGVLAFLLAGAAFTAWSWGLASARAHRASDIELDPHGMTVRGGRKDGLAAAWSALAPGDCTIEEGVSSNLGVYLGRAKYERAFFLRIDGDPQLVAETSELDEEASVRVLVDALVARAGGAAGVRTAAPAVRVASCGGCGAPLEPADVEAVACAHCGCVAPMPAEVRNRIRHAATARAADAELDDAVRRVLDQPGAGRVNGLIAMTAVATSAAAIGVPLASTLEQFGIACVVAAAAVATIMLTRAQIERRRALRDVLVRHAARTDERGVSRCHRCVAPLPRAEGAVSRCVYCAAANVRGVDFGRLAAAASDGARALEADLAARGGRAVVYGVVAAAVTVVGGAGAVLSFVLGGGN